jgi:hypothetical protein
MSAPHNAKDKNYRGYLHLLLYSRHRPSVTLLRKIPGLYCTRYLSEGLRVIITITIAITITIIMIMMMMMMMMMTMIIRLGTATRILTVSPTLFPLLLSLRVCLRFFFPKSRSYFRL